MPENPTNPSIRERIQIMKLLKRIGIAFGLLVAVLVAILIAAYSFFELTKQVEAEPSSDWQTPRTSFGHPSFEGVWTNATVTTLERLLPVPFNKLKLNKAEAGLIEQGFNGFFERDLAPSDPDAPPPEAGGNVGGYNTFWMDPGDKLMVVNGTIRSSIIVDPSDGMVPYRDQTRALLQDYTRGVAGDDARMDGPEQRPLGERCIVGFGSTGGPPMLPVLYNNHYKFVQTPDHVAILVEMNHDTRIVRLDSEHLPDHITPWLGDSIGHWDGDTLVVETTNFHPNQSYRLAIRHQLYVPPSAHVTERFTRIGPQEILYEFSVEDEGAYTQTWKGEMTLRKTKGPIYEYACHEGNYSLPGILAGARYEERKALEAEQSSIHDQGAGP